MADKEKEKELPPITLISENLMKVPILRDLYLFFSPKSKLITAISYGIGSMGIETFLTSSTGCEVSIFDSQPGSAEKFEKYIQILRTHTAGPDANDWERHLENQYVLTKKLHFSNELPFTYSGTLDLSGVTTHLTKFTQEQVHFVKVDYDDFNTSIIYSILNSGYRPGIFLVHWTKNPDSYTDSMLCAGHLQTTGYRLLGQEGNWFLYIFVDDCMYEMCSWARTDVSNPLFEEYKSFVITNLLNTKSNTIEKSQE